MLDKQGKLAREEHISFPEEWPEVQQESGEYTLSLFSGLSAAYLPPMVLDAKQFFRFSQGNYADVPLLVGKNIVNLKSDMKVSVSMSYAVAAVYLSLGGIPEGAIAVEVRISPVSSGISLEGNLSNDGQFATVECRNEKEYGKLDLFMCFLPRVHGPIFLSMLPPYREKRRMDISLIVRWKQESPIGWSVREMAMCHWEDTHR